jgi:hypothetical protein
MTREKPSSLRARVRISNGLLEQLIKTIVLNKVYKSKAVPVLN